MNFNLYRIKNKEINRVKNMTGKLIFDLNKIFKYIFIIIIILAFIANLIMFQVIFTITQFLHLILYFIETFNHIQFLFSQHLCQPRNSNIFS